MKIVVALVFCLLATACGRSDKPNWAEIPTPGGGAFKYDKNSLRKTDEIAITNVENIVAPSVDVGSPSLAKSTYLAQFDCKKRTVSNSQITLTFRDGTTRHEDFWPPEVIPPNVPLEKIFDYSCS